MNNYPTCKELNFSITAAAHKILVLVAKVTSEGSEKPTQTLSFTRAFDAGSHRVGTQLIVLVPQHSCESTIEEQVYSYEITSP